MAALGEHAAAITHSFRNVLTAVAGQAELAIRALPADHPARRHLELVQSASGDGRDLAESLLHFARGERPPFSPVDLNRLVAESVELLRRPGGEAVDAVLDLPAEPLCVKGNAGLLRGVLMALATSVRRSLPRGGPLVFTLRPAVDPPDPGQAVAVLSIAPVSGKISSVSPVEPPRAHQASPSGDDMRMWLARDVIDDHEGCVRVRPVPGGGRCCTLTLPLGAAADGSAPSASGPAAAASVLLVSPDEGTRAILAGGLRSGGHAVIEARGVAEGLGQAAQADPPVRSVVLDVTAEEPPCREDLAALRSAGGAPGVVFLADDAPPGTLAALPADQVLIRPFRLDKLVDLVGRALAAASRKVVAEC